MDPNPADDAQQARQELQQFVYIASHDLQAPVRAIEGYLGLLLRRFGDSLEPKALSYIEKSRNAVRLIQGQIEALLEYSRVSTHGGKLEATALRAAADEAVEAVIDEHGADVVNIVIEDLPDVVGDAGQLARMFEHLFTNSVRHRGDGPASVRVAATSDQGIVTVTVTDEGSGFEADQAEKVLEPFARAHADPPTVGMGLAVCRRIVERHGGEIRLETSPGQGVRVEFTLPSA